MNLRMNLFARAFAGLPMTPAERAFLRLLQGLGGTFLIAALPAVGQALNNPKSFAWQPVLDAAFAAGMNAVLLAALKYRSAKGDTLPAPASPPSAI
jgi:hypothetical protein